MLQLTPSENEVIQLKALGFIEKEIADQRCVSINTVKAQVKSSIRKLRVRTGYQAVAKYVATHPDRFKHMIVTLFMAIQSIVMFNDYREDYRRPAKQKTYRVYKANGRRKN
jgi:DNA-binding CsgD family transcriptional regulator